MRRDFALLGPAPLNPGLNGSRDLDAKPIFYIVIYRILDKNSRAYTNIFSYNTTLQLENGLKLEKKKSIKSTRIVAKIL